jgi:hypothetical protein
VVTVAAPTNRSADVTIIGNDDPAAPGISVEVEGLPPRLDRAQSFAS